LTYIRQMYYIKSGQSIFYCKNGQMIKFVFFATKEVIMSNDEKSTNRKSRQVQRTCSWILEAILLLMDEKPYDKITVSDIIEKAGIARQTFYRNYKDKNEAVVQYFANIFNSELLSVENINEKDKLDNIVLTFNIKYMVNHRVNLKKLLTIAGIEDFFTDRFIEWNKMLFDQKKNKLNKEAQLVYRYKLQYQITGIIIVIMDWFKNDMPSSIDNLVKLLNFFTVDTKILNANVPNIKIKIIDK